MTDMPPLTAEILARRGIDPAAADAWVPAEYDPVTFRTEQAREVLSRVIPTRFAEAKPDHPEVADWVRRYLAAPTEAPSLVLVGPTGTGKALLDSTELATPDGPRPIGTLNVGDEVIGGDGNPCRVVGVYPQGVRSLWRLHLRDGRSVVCDADHLWQVTTRSDLHEGIPPKVLSLAEMMQRGFHYADGSSRWYLPIAGATIYRPVDLPIDPYTLGALIGDGGLAARTPTITTADDEIINSLRLPSGVVARAQVPSRASAATTWALAGRRPLPNPLTVALRSLGLMGRRSSERFIPDCYLRADAQARLDLLAGLVDTDGYVTGTSVSISTSSARLAADIQRLVWSLGGCATSRRKETTHLPAWTVHLSLPAGSACPARLPRKAARWAPRRDGRGNTVALVRVERVLDGSATCIAVDSPDSTYLTADYVRTHNTWQCWGAVRAVVEGLAAAGRGLIWRATTHPDLNAALRPKPDQSHSWALEPYLEAELLLLDDVGAGKQSDWTGDSLYRLVDHRWSNRKTTIYSTNLTAKALTDAVGDRVVSRLADAVHVAIKGTDRRWAA